MHLKGFQLHLAALGVKAQPPSGPIRKNNVREYNVSVIAEHLDGRFIDVNTRLTTPSMGYSKALCSVENRLEKSVVPDAERSMNM